MHTLLTLLLQIAVVLVVARVTGWLFRKINQPQVVGEMTAGILLGPSVLGWLAPGVFGTLFPSESLIHLNTLSQVGLVLFMFLVGLELDPAMLRGRGHVALVTSHASIVTPFFFGSLLALYLYPSLSDQSVNFTEFALFMGAAMSVTAFPVLARILRERNLLQSKMGAVTIACAAVDDVTAWCILAGVVALVRATGVTSVLITLGGSALYILAMIFLVRPLLRKLETTYNYRGILSQDVFALVLLLLLASAWTTEWLGIHALFGAFLLGAIMPQDKSFVHELTEKIESLTVVFLLPLFFAYTGLRTQIGLLDEKALWLDAAIVIAVAVAGKFGGSTLAARLTGLSWREAGGLGVLMNTRGLMELVILSIGLDLGVISPALFAMMVLMALLTTFMTTPLLELIYPPRLIRQQALEDAGVLGAYTVLIPISLPSSGPVLLDVARAIAPPDRSRFYALYLSRIDNEQLFSRKKEETDDMSALQPLLDAAKAYELDVHPLAFVSGNIGEDITSVAQTKAADLVLMGWHKPVLSQSILSGTVYDVMSNVKADVAVYMARQFGPWRRVLVPYGGSIHDRAALELARHIARTDGTEITILHVVKPDRSDAEPRLGFSGDAESFAEDNIHLKVIEGVDPLESAVSEAQRNYDLVIIGASEEWGLQPTLFTYRHERFARSCPASMLIIRRGKAQT